jgi:membrane-bound serine protease (ClpP class)
MTGLTLILALMVLGLGLLLLEIFLPGMIAGILGVLCLLAAIGEAHHRYSIRGTFWVMLAEAILVGLGFWGWSRYFPQTALGKRMFLTESNRVPESSDEIDFTVGEVGLAVTELRPAGTAEFAGRRCDVVSESAFIPAGEKVKIHQIEKFRVVVRKI